MILSEGAAKRGFELLHASGLLAAVLPEIAAMEGVAQSPLHHPEGDVLRHTLLVIDQLRSPTETLAFGALLHDVAKPVCVGHRVAPEGDRITFYGHPERGAEMAIAICQRLKRSRAVWERVAYLVRNHLRLVNAPRMRAATLKRFLREDGIEELLELARIDATAASGDLQYYEFCRAQLAALSQEEMRPPLVALVTDPGRASARSCTRSRRHSSRASSRRAPTRSRGSRARTRRTRRRPNARLRHRASAAANDVRRGSPVAAAAVATRAAQRGCMRASCGAGDIAARRARCQS